MPEKLSEEQYLKGEEEFQKYQTSLHEPVTVTPQQVANILHQQIYTKGEHGLHHSCPCYHLALFYLGVTDNHGLYWPDGKGGNAWDAKEDTENAITTTINPAITELISSALGLIEVMEIQEQHPAGAVWLPNPNWDKAKVRAKAALETLGVEEVNGTKNP